MCIELSNVRTQSRCTVFIGSQGRFFCSLIRHPSVKPWHLSLVVKLTTAALCIEDLRKSLVVTRQFPVRQIVVLLLTGSCFCVDFQPLLCTGCSIFHFTTCHIRLWLSVCVCVYTCWHAIHMDTPVCKYITFVFIGVYVCVCVHACLQEWMQWMNEWDEIWDEMRWDEMNKWANEWTHKFLYNIYYQLVARCLYLLLIIAPAYLYLNSGPFQGASNVIDAYSLCGNLSRRDGFCVSHWF
jgi:hypothetical protein